MLYVPIDCRAVLLFVLPLLISCVSSHTSIRLQRVTNSTIPPKELRRKNKGLPSWEQRSLSLRKRTARRKQAQKNKILQRRYNTTLAWIKGRNAPQLGQECAFTSRCYRCCWRIQSMQKGFVDTGSLESSIERVHTFRRCLKYASIQHVVFFLHVRKEGRISFIKLHQINHRAKGHRWLVVTQARRCLGILLRTHFKHVPRCARSEFVTWKQGQVSLVDE